MKNIIIILLILILPVSLYLLTANLSENHKAFAFNKNNPSVLIFTSPMCMDCNKLKSVINEIEQDYNSKINFVYIDPLKNSKGIREKIKKYGVTLVPTIVFTDVNEVQTKKIEGFVSKEQLVSVIEDTVNE